MSFNTKASSYQNTLVNINSKNKKEFIKFVNNLKATGITNYEDAFDKAFSLLDREEFLNIKIKTC